MGAPVMQAISSSGINKVFMILILMFKRLHKFTIEPTEPNSISKMRWIF